MATMPKIELPEGIAELLPQGSLVRQLSEGRAEGFQGKILAVAKSKVEARLAEARDGIAKDGPLKVFRG